MEDAPLRMIPYFGELPIEPAGDFSSTGFSLCGFDLSVALKKRTFLNFVAALNCVKPREKITD
jgi:hypothetical protein